MSPGTANPSAKEHEVVASLGAVVLTRNEAPNIGRLLERLRWVETVVVLDSESSDDTERIARSYSNVIFARRAFDDHASQWTAAVAFLPAKTRWVLSLDADHLPTAEFVREVGLLSADCDAYVARFRYVLLGRELRCGIYPPKIVLFRRDRCEFFQDGHTQRIRCHGPLRTLRHHLLHDDRKAPGDWFDAQVRYAALEASVGRRTGQIRSILRAVPPVAAIAVFLYVFLLRGGFLDGKAGLIYACQRGLAEHLVAVRRVWERAAAGPESVADLKG